MSDSTICAWCKQNVGGFSVYVKVDTGYVATCCGDHADKLLASIERQRQRFLDRKK